MPSLTLLENQGFSNTNYILKTSKKSYAIRVFGSLHVNRKKEFMIANKAYKKGIGAKPIYHDDCFMISEFLEGFHKYRLKKEDIKNIALLLKRLHSIKIEKKLFNFKRKYVLCHNDLNPKNFIFSDNIKLIDWEYASSNDQYFDLLSVVTEFNLNKKEEKLFLQYYFKSSYSISRKKVYIFRVKYLKLSIEWFKKQNNSIEKYRYKKKLYARNTR